MTPEPPIDLDNLPEGWSLLDDHVCGVAPWIGRQGRFQHALGIVSYNAGHNPEPGDITWVWDAETTTYSLEDLGRWSQAVAEFVAHVRKP